jgi:hypothetical protein
MAYSIFGGEKFDQAALAFAKNCLLQPESYIEADSFRVCVRPDGFDTGPEPCADYQDLNYDDLDDVTMIVTYWCQLNSVKLEIVFEGESFFCRFMDGDPMRQTVETAPTLNLCFALLDGSSTLAQRMKNVTAPHPSMSWRSFAGQDDEL